MTSVYLITNDHCWSAFFKDLYGQDTAKALNALDMQRRLPVIQEALKEHNSTPILAETLRGDKYVKGAEFETEEDLLVFKIKFS
jgi:hypothetical protein